MNFHWLITFNPPWNNMVVCAAFIILPNGISSFYYLQSYTYSQHTFIYLTVIKKRCHSPVSFSTDYNQCDAGSNPRPGQFLFKVFIFSNSHFSELFIDLSYVVLFTALRPIRRSFAGTRNLFSCFWSERQVDDGMGTALLNFTFSCFPSGTRIYNTNFIDLMGPAWPRGYRLRTVS